MAEDQVLKRGMADDLDIDALTGIGVGLHASLQSRAQHQQLRDPEGIVPSRNMQSVCTEMQIHAEDLRI